MVLDGRTDWTEWTDGRKDDAKTISLRLRRGITKYYKLVVLLKKFVYEKRLWNNVLVMLNLCLTVYMMEGNMFDFLNQTV